MPSYTVIRGARVLDARIAAAPGASEAADLAVKLRGAPHADVLVEDDTIVEVGEQDMPAPADAAVIDAKDRLLIPGLVNAHTHSHANIPRGFGDRWTLELALNANGAIRGQPSVEDKYVAAQLGAAEMIRKGCTACYDLVYEFPQPSVEGLNALGQAYADAGMRAVVAPLMSTQSFYAAIPGLMDVLPDAVQAELRKPRASTDEPSLEITREALHGWQHDRTRVRLAIAPHSPLQVSDAFWTGAHRLAMEFGVGVHTHLGESKVQAVGGVKRYGKTLTAHMAALGVLGPHFTAAHGTWLDLDDMQRLADAGASVAHNPASNMRYGNGMAAVRRMLDCGLNVGLGTDSRSCSDNLNMFEAMRLASFTSRVQTPDYTRWLHAHEALAMATTGSAQALGFGGDLGRIEKGFKADIVFLDLRNLNYIPLNSAINQVVNAEDTTGVDSVMIGGRMVLDRGRLTTIDEARLKARAEAAMERVWSVNGKALELALRLEEAIGTFCVALAQSPYHVHRYCGGAGS
ncbi:MAG TPA: amidohydrolase family protein [Burkholderiales bacterium]|nr:amidohydrolase family protein [Burkholderiales bacterium]